jgi:hypothetical protein
MLRTNFVFYSYIHASVINKKFVRELRKNGHYDILPIGDKFKKKNKIGKFELIITL